jgi:hypothetical protein
LIKSEEVVVEDTDEAVTCMDERIEIRTTEVSDDNVTGSWRVKSQVREDLDLYLGTEVDYGGDTGDTFFRLRLVDLVEDKEKAIFVVEELRQEKS